MSVSPAASTCDSEYLGSVQAMPNEQHTLLHESIASRARTPDWRQGLRGTGGPWGGERDGGTLVQLTRWDYFMFSFNLREARTTPRLRSLSNHRIKRVSDPDRR